MNSEQMFHRYRELQEYVGWSNADAEHVRSVATILRPFIAPLVDDFYEEIERHPAARKVITGGPAQIERLKGTLRQWLEELVSGQYDEAYVIRRWRVGWRHVEIGLDQVYTNTALSRLRTGLFAALDQVCLSNQAAMPAIRLALNKLLDLDLAIIEDAYQAEFRLRQQRSERLAAIGKIAGGIAHELRNPLNVIKTSVYYLLNAQNPSPEKMTAHLERIDRQVLLADNVITALNNFAKLPLPELQPLQVAPLLTDAIELNPLPNTIQVVRNCPETLPPVLGDVHQLRIVFGNLIRNARDAMPEGGLLTLAAQQEDAQIAITIADTGSGIAKEDLGRIMEPLYSTKSRGIGLGLAIVSAILEKHSGSLKVASELNRGTSMTVRLLAGPIESLKQGSVS